jgi:LPXTG-motif cell wall-anchored protein
VLLGKGVSNSSGELALTVTIPLGTVAGAHTITISPTADPSTIVATVALTVRGSLAFTGTDPTSGLIGGGILMLLGAVLLVVRRRRPTISVGLRPLD